MKKRYGCLIILLVAVVAACIAGLSVTGGFRFSTITNFGAAQYVQNIMHFHKPRYYRALQDIEARKSIGRIAADEECLFTLKARRIFICEGYVKRNEVTWIAITVFRGMDAVHAYIMVPESEAVLFGEKVNSAYIERLPADYLRSFDAIYRKEYEDALMAKVRVIVPADNLGRQKARENRALAVVPDLRGTVSFYEKKDAALVKRIHGFYLGERYTQVRLTQIDDGFTLEPGF
ncbi:MAG: hypothetical protein HZC28_11570 [Spirochaetes bacterium]|nr:hypothetical protein [Spirochaetota bacterium]